MKYQLPGSEWKEIGKLVEVTSISLHPELPRGTVFVTDGGVKVLFTQEEMNMVGGNHET